MTPKNFKQDDIDLLKAFNEQNEVRAKEFLIKRIKELNSISANGLSSLYNIKLHSDVRIIGRNICMISEGIAQQEKLTEQNIWKTDLKK